MFSEGCCVHTPLICLRRIHFMTQCDPKDSSIINFSPLVTRARSRDLMLVAVEAFRLRTNALASCHTVAENTGGLASDTHPHILTTASLASLGPTLGTQGTQEKRVSRREEFRKQKKRTELHDTEKAFFFWFHLLKVQHNCIYPQ